MAWWKRSLWLGSGVLAIAIVLMIYLSVAGNNLDAVSRADELLAPMLSDESRERASQRNRSATIRLGRVAEVAQAMVVTGSGLLLVAGGLKVIGFDRPRCPHCQARVHPNAHVCARCGRDQ